MGAPQYEQAGADIGGTGTTNYIPRWNPGPSTLGDSGLIDNGTAIYTTTRNVGIGTASPNAILSVYNASTPTISLWNSSNFTRFSTNTNDCFIDVGLGGTAGALIFRRSSSATESARIDSAGRWLVGVSGVPVSSEIKAAIGGAGNGGQEWIGATGGGVACVPINGGGGQYYTFTGLIGGELYTPSFKVVSTGLEVSNAGYGLKLPATPGNADTQTLDCYAEGTWTPTRAGFGGTNPTVTANYTRVGRLVTIAVTLTATGGNQYSGALGSTTLTVPSAMTPSVTASSTMTNGAVANVGNVAAFSDGFIYLPTFGLTTTTHQFTITYSV